MSKRTSNLMRVVLIALSCAASTGCAMHAKPHTQKADERSLALAMESMGDSLGRISKQYADPKQDVSTLAAIETMRAAALQAQGVLPAMAWREADVAKRDAIGERFRAKLGELINTCDALRQRPCRRPHQRQGAARARRADHERRSLGVHREEVTPILKNT
ncbi:MAG: hypothetical protein QM770_01535 [Tepidisphaeraceae bacterium]